ncbi:hypothetical protein KKB10_02010 [Patescibacteria group bacterium]|nr:hypothetical protein [Patescibacteria group bacterium]MBU1074584.1 hypothetical protein [Patescibacteria group bacterium]MBU1952372.1 hypothetical protein [Patescibacteria group bacterium]
MPGEPKPEQESPLDIPGLVSELDAITAQWGVEDLMERNEVALRQRESKVATVVDKLLNSDVTGEKEPALLESVIGAIGMFDGQSTTFKLKELKAKLEGK